MTDRLLFTIVPYAAAVAFAATAIYGRLAATRGPHGRSRERGLARASAVVAACALGIVGLHVLLLVAPRLVLRWNRETTRLVLLEAVGICAGAVWAIAVVAALLRHVVDCARGGCSFARTIALTLLAIEVVSGLTLAAGYRWASSWSVVTLTPYVASLARFTPRVDLIAPAPFIVRLHVICTFAIVALLPFTDSGSLVLLAFNRCVDAVLMPLAKAFGSSRARVENPVARVWRAQTAWNEEEN
jgi:nitrate reductase gamma subunit